MARRTSLTRAAFAGLLISAAPATAQGVLTVAMTAGDIPVTGGNPDQGFEGFRFVALNLYDALINWDLSRSDRPSTIKPGLATEWHVDPANTRRWLFTLRQGVKFHDGCAFTADDVVWNFGRFDEKAPQWNPQQFALSRAYLPNFAGVEKVDDHTVALTTKIPSALFPYEMSYVLMTSRCRAEALKYDWAAYASQPSGTGPYRFDRMVPHERLEMVPNKEYWDAARVPKQDRLVLLPVPEASTRTAALLSGQVNFVEAPTPDAVPRLKSSGMTVITNTYPHNWSYQLNFVNGPFKDVRVRRAANYALNRADIVELLGGIAQEGPANFPPSSALYGKPVSYKYDLGKAQALLKEAGCTPCAVTLAISTSGSGQMQPLPMNELIKSQLEEAGFKVTLRVMDWNALRALRGGTAAMVFQEPMTALDPVYTVGQQICETVRQHLGLGRAAARARALEMLELVRVPDAARRLNAYPHQLSGGLRQRVVIAMALSCRPRLLLADEPTTALDATVQIQVLLLLRDLQRELGMGMVIVTHDLGVAAEAAARVAVMYAGQIVEQGPVRDVLRRPAHPYTQGLLASVIREGAGEIGAIPGSPPDLRRPPPGCAFAPRCPAVLDACRAAVPEERTVGEARTARCIRVDGLVDA